MSLLSEPYQRVSRWINYSHEVKSFNVLQEKSNVEARRASLQSEMKKIEIKERQTF